MATTTNGEDAPPTTYDDSKIAVADPNALKRKRDEGAAASEQNALSISRVKHIQRDILHVLEKHDTSPSFLKHAFSSPNANEPSHKKARLSDPNNESSAIASKLNESSYTSLQQLAADAKHVGEELVAEIQSKAKERDGAGAGRASVDELKQIHRIHTFEMLVQEFVETETQHVEAAHRSDVEPKKGDSSNDGDAVDSQPNGRVGTVLTLFGNAPTPKQLFSSRQHAPNEHQQPWVTSELPVDEMPLPNGISATKIIPAALEESKKGPTFEDAFPPPYSLAPLNPPKTHKRPSTRDNTISWEFKDLIQRNKRGGYTVQPLTVGDWLSYGSADSEHPPSPRERRKQRTRALSSSGETAERSTNELSDDELRRQEEALFRRAFSSFAPSHDDSNAVIPTQTRNEAWWNKIGNKRFNDTFAIDPALLDDQAPNKPSFNPLEVDFKEEEFGKVLDELGQLEDAKPELESESTKDKTDVEQVLRDISELLETLASHQRIRNASLPASSTASRTPISPAPIVVSKSDKPVEPTDTEVSTYNSLRRELAYLILKLPPYAVAKLDGDQLADLRVTELITYHTKDVKGTMEEDFVTRQAKMAAMATANSIANLARPNSSAGQHYSTTAQRTPAIGQAANTRYGQQYGQRTPAQFPTLQRQPSAQQTYGTPTAAPRPAYTQPNQYTRPGAPQQPTYGQPNAQQYYQQRPQQLQQTPGGYGYNQQYQQAPLAQRPTFPPHQPQQYQQRSHAAAANAVGYQTNTPTQQHAYQNRTASPSKPVYPTPLHPQPIQQAGAQQRPIYQAPPQQPGSGRATPVSYPTPVNGYPAPHRQPQGIAPRPASTTPQPPQYQAPPPGPTQQQVTTNVSSPALSTTQPAPQQGFGRCLSCGKDLTRGEHVEQNHVCIELKCKRCRRQFYQQSVFKKHSEKCTGLWDY